MNLVPNVDSVIDAGIVPVNYYLFQGHLLISKFLIFQHIFIQ